MLKLASMTVKSRSDHEIMLVCVPIQVVPCLQPHTCAVALTKACSHAAHVVHMHMYERGCMTVKPCFDHEFMVVCVLAQVVPC